jgi:hypothetical protein
MRSSPRTAELILPTPFERRRLSVATLGISDAAIVRAYRDPSSVRESTLLRLKKAADELGIRPPRSRAGAEP